MKIYTRIVLDMESGLVLESEGYDYDGPVDLCKGEGHAQDQLNSQNAMQKEAFDYQKGILDQMKSAFSQYTTGAGQGFDPAQLALLQSKFLDQNASTFNDAGSNVRSALLARGGGGGDLPVGGDFGKMMGTLEAAKATSQSGGIRDIGLADLAQALTNRFNAGSLMSGNAATLNSPISTFGSGASNALNQYMSAANSGFGAMFMKALGGSLGAGVGSLAMGGIGGGLGALGSLGSTGIPKGLNSGNV